jgi:hypothetical protein
LEQTRQANRTQAGGGLTQEMTPSLPRQSIEVRVVGRIAHGGDFLVSGNPGKTKTGLN